MLCFMFTAEIQLNIHLYSFFLRFFSYIGYHSLVLFNSRFVPFNYLPLVLPSPPSTSGNLSFLMFDFLFRVPHISEIMNLSFYDSFTCSQFDFEVLTFFLISSTTTEFPCIPLISSVGVGKKELSVCPQLTILNQSLLVDFLNQK